MAGNREGSFVFDVGLLDLHVALDIRNRTHIITSSPKRVVGHEKRENAGPYHTTPVHIARRRVRGRREKLKDPEHREETQRDDVDCVSGLAKAEARGWEGFAAESFMEDALQNISFGFYGFEKGKRNMLETYRQCRLYSL